MAQIETPDAPAAPVEEPYPPTGYAWYVVIVLTIVYMFSFVDRQILNLLVGPIRKDLEISDTQMSLLMGFSFALFYSVFGIPLGRLADLKSRRAIIGVGLTAWSLFTAGCGLAKNFPQMLFMRMGVGIGEATLSPAAYSLIADYFPAHKRGTALGIYSMGIYVGSGLSFILGGAIAELARTHDSWFLPVIGEVRPWQIVFFIVGLPGVLLALVMLTVREPKRRGRATKTAAGGVATGHESLSTVATYLKSNWQTLFCHNVGFGLLSLSSYAASAWVPTMFVRNHGWTAYQAGMTYGLIVAIFSTMGVVSGGWLTDWFSRRGYRDAGMRVGLLFGVIWASTGIFFPIVTDPTLAVALLIPTCFMASAPFSAAPAAIQQVMPNAMRAQASSIYLLVLGLIGMGGGPLAVALTTDRFFQDDNKVNYSLVVVMAVAHVLAAILLFVGLRYYRRSDQMMREWTTNHT